jgi:sugar O-acyltransferase (sialic acid O-acetyltransferase NeuD family)
MNLLIWGKGGHAKVVRNAVNTVYYSNIIHLDDNSEEVLNGSWLENYPTKHWKAFVAIGDNSVRERLYKKLEGFGYDIGTIIAAGSYVAPSASIGRGSFVAQGAIVQPDAYIYEGCILNTGCSVDHDCVVKPFTHIAPGVHLCGKVQVGSRVLLGVGSSVIPGITIADDVVVAGGSAVKDNIILNGGLWAGVPAKPKMRLVRQHA